MTCEPQTYGNFEFLNISADNPAELDGLEAKNMRVEMPADARFVSEMAKKGFCLGDRTIGATINLAKSAFDYNRFIRFDIRKADGNTERIYEIACECFEQDRRFHVRPELDSKLASLILEQWVKELGCVYLCWHKDHIVGFLDVECCGDNSQFVHLAAVEPKYQAAGAAMSLYAYAFKVAKENGLKKLMGRVSTRNVSALNLYVAIGATFEKPVDVYLKEG